LEYKEIIYITIIKITIAIARNTNFLFLKNEEDFFLNKDDPHLEQTILPPKDRSETKEQLPQLTQTLFAPIKKIIFSNSN
jgi:hypothetical protein